MTTPAAAPPTESNASSLLHAALMESLEIPDAVAPEPADEVEATDEQRIVPTDAEETPAEEPAADTGGWDR